MKKILGIALIIFVGLTGAAFGQSAKQAYKALKKVEARTDTGVSYRDYPQVISEAKVEVDDFLKSKEANKNPQLAEHLKKAMGYYLIAGEIWRLKFGIGKPTDLIYPNTTEGKLIARLYPKARAEGTKPPPGSNYSPELERMMAEPTYLIPEILRNIWADATKELRIASEYIKTD